MNHATFYERWLDDSFDIDDIGRLDDDDLDILRPSASTSRRHRAPELDSVERGVDE